MPDNVNRQDISLKLVQHIQELHRRIPYVSDKALVDLVNGLQINQDFLQYRKHRGFFGYLMDVLSKKEYGRALLFDRNLIEGQNALTTWARQLTDSLSISEVALTVTQQSLMQVRHSVRIQRSELDDLRYQIDSFQDQLKEKIFEYSDRISRLEVRVAANEDLDRSLTSWLARDTYVDLPWSLQVVLLVQEIFSSAVMNYELQTGDLYRYRQLVINKISSSSETIPDHPIGLADLLDVTCQDAASEDIELFANLLEVRSIPQMRLSQMPYLFSIGTALETACLPEKVKPRQLGNYAIAVCHSHIAKIPVAINKKGFVTAIVNEIANDNLLILANRD